MKKILLTCLVLLGLVVLAVAIFVVTFDVDRYRPMLARRLQEAIHRPVTLERLSLNWRGGIAVQVQGLRISDEASAGPEPVIQLESASALVRPLPLLRKEVQVASLVLRRPRIRIARDAQGRIDLLGLAAAASPALSAIPPGTGQAGAVSSRPTSVGDAVVSFNIASFRIEDGTLHWSDATTQPPSELWLKRLDVTVRNIALGRPMDVALAGALAADAPNLRLSGRFTTPSPSRAGSLEQANLMIEGLPLERILPPARPGEPQLQGKLTVNVHGSVATLDPSQLARAISGEGGLGLAEARIANLNVLRAVFERFSMLPGLVEALQARLPPAYQAKLAESDTVFEPIDLALRVEEGSLRFEDMRVRSDTFELIGTGYLGLDGNVDIRSTLRIEPTLSAAIFRSVEELRTLANASGELEIPLAIQGQAPRVAVLPDLRYVASRIVVTTAVDLIGQLLRKDTPEAGGEAGSDQAEGSPDDILGQLLKKAIRRGNPSDAPPSSH
ncbi:MAG: AsmA family protein [Candidatus Omnitrophica bacterium]|nr:AsmA family protein [Candidatus Omnitrophota bacterium]